MYRQRIKIFMALVAAILLALIARLAHLQIISGEQYRRLAEELLQQERLLPARRGTIYDRHEQILAIDEPCHDFCLDYKFIEAEAAEPEAKWVRWHKAQIAAEVHRADAEMTDAQVAARAEEVYRDRGQAARRLASRWVTRQQRRIERELRNAEAELTAPEAEAMAEEAYRERAAAALRTAGELAALREVDLAGALEKIKYRVRRIRSRVGMAVAEQFYAHPVVRGLDDKTTVAVEAKLAGLIGVRLRPSHQRRYPRGETACHTIGLTGPVTAESLPRLNEAFAGASRVERRREGYLSFDRVGIAGVEKMSESILRGLRGYRVIKRTSNGPVTLESTPALAGRDVHTTLDAELQEALARLLVGRGVTGAIAVLSVPAGEVLALVSVPTYDLNKYRQIYPRLVGDEIYLPLLHRAVARGYPPGSGVKPSMALAGLATGRITPHEQIDCRGPYYPHKPRVLRCWKFKQYGASHGPLNVVEGIFNSCNVFFFEIGNRLGSAGAFEWLGRFGYGRRPGTGLPEERAGYVRPAEKMTRDERILMAVGQGPISATPLQVANAMATIARDAEFRSPMLTLEGGPKRIRRRLPVEAAHVELVQRGMHKVTRRPGTAWRVFGGSGVRPLGFEVCGKTGTAQTTPQRRDSNGNGRIDRRDEIVRMGDTAWFSGFAPYPKPTIAFAVVVEFIPPGGSGGRNAGPIAIDVLRLAKRRGYIR